MKHLNVLRNTPERINRKIGKTFQENEKIFTGNFQKILMNSEDKS